MNIINRESALQIRRDQVAREDLVLFINACFSCSGQREFYSDGSNQRVSIDFLHRYILGNYRLLYARTLAAGINHFNAAQIVVNLLSIGKDTRPEHRVEEGALILATLRALPPNRAWRVLESVRKRKINNRRSRAITRQYLESRRDIVFESIKYRSKVRSSMRHCHLNMPGEIGNFLSTSENSAHFRLRSTRAIGKPITAPTPCIRFPSRWRRDWRLNTESRGMCSLRGSNLK